MVCAAVAAFGCVRPTPPSVSILFALGRLSARPDLERTTKDCRRSLRACDARSRDVLPKRQGCGLVRKRVLERRLDRPAHEGRGEGLSCMSLDGETGVAHEREEAAGREPPEPVPITGLRLERPGDADLSSESEAGEVPQ